MMTKRASVFLAMTWWVVACGSDGGVSPPPIDAGAEAPAAPPTVMLVQNAWDASRINVAIARVLLTEQLGLTVTVTEIDEYAQWEPIAKGDQHASLEVWPSGHKGDIAKYVETGRVEDGGALGPVGKISWYVPTYLLTAYPQLATWTAYKDSANTDLFKTPETGTKGRFLTGDPTWTQYDADIIRNLGMNLQVVYAGSEQAELAELDATYARRDPILLYLWVPHSALAKYDLTAVQLPPYSDACYAQAQSGGVACDYPPDHLFKIFWPELATKNPKAYHLLKAFTYTTKDQIGLLGRVDNQHDTIDAVARAWIAANESTWRGWLP